MTAAHDTEPHPSKERLRLWLRLLRASKRIESDMQRLLKREYSMTLPRFDVLAALHRAEDGLTMSELSRTLMVSNGNVTGIVDRLEEQELVHRAFRNGDRRTSHVRLTDTGFEYFERMARAHEAWISRRLNDLSPEETSAAIELLKKIETSAERHGR